MMRYIVVYAHSNGQDEISFQNKLAAEKLAKKLTNDGFSPFIEEVYDSSDEMMKDIYPGWERGRRGGRGKSPYPPADRKDLIQIKVPRRLSAQLKAYAERIAWETIE